MTWPGCQTVFRLFLLLVVVRPSESFIRILGVFSSENPIAPHGPKGLTDQCSNITDACRGGYPTLRSWFRELSRNTEGTIRITTPDVTSRTVRSHPEGLRWNYKMWNGLGIDFLTFRTNYPITAAPESRRVEVANFLMASSIPAVLSNYHVDETNIYLLDLITRMHVRTIADTKISTMVLWDDYFVGVTAPVYPATAVLSIITNKLRREHVDIIAVFITGNIGSMWSESRYLEIATTGVDVVVCDIPYFPNETRDGIIKTTIRMNTTFFFVTPGYDLISLDVGNKTEKSFKLNTVSLRDPIPDTHDLVKFNVDTQWIQTEINKAWSSQMIIGISNGPLEVTFIDETNYKPCLERECQLGRLTTDAMAYTSSNNIAIINGGALRGIGWPSGPITQHILLESLPYPDVLCVLNVTGPALLSILNHGLKALLENSTVNSHSSLGSYLQVSGMRYTYNSFLPSDSRVTSVEIYNSETRLYEPIQRRATYSITTTEFLLNGGDGFGDVLSDRVEGSLICSLRSLLSTVNEYLKDHNPYIPHVDSIISDGNREALEMTNKTAANCTIYEKHLPYWSDCESCPDGYWHPNSGDDPCIKIIKSKTDFPLFWILIASGGFILLIAVPVGWKLTERSRRIRHLYNNNRIAEECAAAVVELRLSDLDYLSNLEKPNTIQQSFIKIVEQMKIYMDFMPKALIVNVHDEGIDALDTSVKSISVPVSLSLSISRDTREVTQSTNPLLRSTVTVTDLSEKINHIRRKRITVLAANCRDLLKFDTADTLTEKIHSAYLETFNTIVEAHHGVTEGGCGDRLIAGWNTVNDKCSTTQKVCAVTAAHKLSTSQLDPLCIDVGIGHGEAKVGLCGGRGARKYDILGRPVTQAIYLMILNKVYSTSILLPHAVATDCVPFFASEVIDHITYPKIGRVLLYRLAEPKRPQKDGEEWMYVVGDAENDDPYAVHNSHWIQFITSGEVPRSSSLSGRLLELQVNNPSGVIEDYCASHQSLALM